ncbi:MAG: MFS transporter [Candidatus Brocadiaceae bacterium]|nr:MFS transporter [Candidatus Brocadiaceae bacterium]
MEQQRPPSVRWLTASVCASFLVYASTPTLLAVSLKAIGADLGLGYGAQGALVLARSVALGIITVLAGFLADRWGKRLILPAAMLLAAVGMLVVGGSTGLAGLLVGVMVTSIGLGGLEALNGALVSDLYPQSVDSRVNAIFGFYPVGVVISSLAVGAALDAGVDWRAPFALLAIPSILVMAMFRLGRYPASSSAAGARRLTVRGILADPRFWLLAAVMLLTAGAMGCMVYWGPSFLQDEYGTSAKVGSAALAVFMVAMAVGRFGTGAATRLAPLLRIMLVMAVLGAGASLGVVLVDHAAVTIVLYGAAGLGIACFWPGVVALAVSRIGAGSSVLLAMVCSVGILAFGFIPAGVGLLAARWGLRAALGVCPVSMVLAALLLAGQTWSEGRAAGVGRGSH